MIAAGQIPSGIPMPIVERSINGALTRCELSLTDDDDLRTIWRLVALKIGATPEQARTAVLGWWYGDFRLMINRAGERTELASLKILEIQHREKVRAHAMLFHAALTVEQATAALCVLLSVLDVAKEET